MSDLRDLVDELRAAAKDVFDTIHQRLAEAEVDAERERLDADAREYDRGVQAALSEALAVAGGNEYPDRATQDAIASDLAALLNEERKRYGAIGFEHDLRAGIAAEVERLRSAGTLKALGEAAALETLAEQLPSLVELGRKVREGEE